MAKKNRRDLNASIEDQDKKDEAVISVSAIIKQLKRYLAVWLVIAIIAGLLTFCYSAYKTFSSRTPVSALVSFTYTGIEKGLDPKGRKFEIESMKNDKIVKNALAEVGLATDKTEDIKTGISFDYRIPQSAYDQLTAHSSVMDQASSGSLSAAQAMLDTKYYPTQFTVKLDLGKAGLNRQEGVDFLNALLKKYGEYFYEEYGYNEPLGEAVSNLEYKDYDYAQQVDLFRNSLKTIKNYLDSLAKDDNTTFRSSVTGYTFNDLADYAKTITSIDLDRISSYISVNNVTKDKDAALAYYNYRIENLNRDKDEYTERLSALENSIAQYQKDVIQVFGNGTDNTDTESTLHSEQYDSLFKQKTSVEASLAQTKQDISFYTSRRDALQNNKNSSKANVDRAEADIAELSNKVNELVDLTKKTVSDYYENVQFANAYNILVPAAKSTVGSLKMAVSDSMKTIVVVEFLLLAVYLAAAFITAVKAKLSRKLAKAGADDDDDFDIEELAEKKAEKAKKNTNSKKNKKK